MQTLKVVSCFGHQIEESTIDVINSGPHRVLSVDMKTELRNAVEEGLLEHAGPIYRFSHDLIHQTLYNNIDPDIRKLLHKTIGDSLLKGAPDIQKIHLLAVDHLNIYGKDGNLSLDERSQYIHANARAVEYAVALSSFEQGETPYSRVIYCKLIIASAQLSPVTISQKLY